MTRIDVSTLPDRSSEPRFLRSRGVVSTWSPPKRIGRSGRPRRSPDRRCRVIRDGTTDRRHRQRPRPHQHHGPQTATAPAPRTVPTPLLEPGHPKQSTASAPPTATAQSRNHTAIRVPTTLPSRLRYAAGPPLAGEPAVSLVPRAGHSAPALARDAHARTAEHCRQPRLPTTHDLRIHEPNATRNRRRTHRHGRPDRQRPRSDRHRPDDDRRGTLHLPDARRPLPGAQSRPDRRPGRPNHRGVVPRRPSTLPPSTLAPLTRPTRPTLRSRPCRRDSALHSLSVQSADLHSS